MKDCIIYRNLYLIGEKKHSLT